MYGGTARGAASSGGAHAGGADGGKDFLVALLVLVAATMKADGRVVKSELEEVKRFLLAHYAAGDAQKALSLLKELLEKDIALGPVCEQIRWNMPHAGRLELVSLLVRISVADGEFAGSERNLTFRIARMLGVSAADYVSICAAAAQSFRERADAGDGAGEGGSSRRSRAGSPHASSDPDWAYKVLEGDRSATDEEIKKAYRKMAMKYHPDRVATLGEEVKKSATEKFQAVAAAYDAIKEERGIA
jgi:DnaJ like chaperone protein